VPGGAEAAASPLVAGHDLLTSYLATRDGEMPEAERKLAELERLKLEVASEGPDAETAYQYGYHKSVSALNDHFYSATRTEVRRWERADLQATHWQMRRGNGGRSAWAPAWRLEITVEPAGADHDRIVRRLGHPTAVRIVDAIGTRGEATIADIAEATGLHKAGVRNWIARLCQSGTVVQARGRGTPRSPAVYAVAYDSLIVDCAPTR
jgi:DNA-binding transcriptional ArsR family regulator